MGRNFSLLNFEARIKSEGVGVKNTTIPLNLPEQVETVDNLRIQDLEMIKPQYVNV